MNDDITVEIVGDLQPENKRPKSNVARQQNKVVGVGGVSPCILSTHARHEFKIMETEKAILTPIRSEEQKAARRAGQDCKFGERPLQPREDGVSNTLTSVAKDNLVVEREVLGWTRDEQGNVVDRHPVAEANCVTAAPRDNTRNYVREQGKRTRIRRLTVRELFRLMDVEEADIDTLLGAGIANTQLAKMAGNSIVVSCLYYIFRNLYIERGPQAGEQVMLF